MRGRGIILDQDAFGIWSFISKRTFKANFKRENQEIYKRWLTTTIDGNRISIYIHYPFCRSLCPFCPYVRTLWNKEMADNYFEALKREIRIYGNLLRDLDLKVDDIHVGGGSPSLLDGDEYKEILKEISQHFEIESDCRLGIEVNPEDLEEKKALRLYEGGVKEISIGVQSFFTENLKLLGRRHSVEDSLEAIRNAKKTGFSLINLDMMYMFPGQDIKQWIQDIKLAIEQDPDQITLYPLLVTRYASGYKKIKEGGLPKQPSLRVFKKMYYTAVDLLEKAGYKPIRYYSFSKTGEEYSTVEREMVGPLIAFGAGAMGFTGGVEYVNTCSVKEYIRSIEGDFLPIVGIRSVSKEERAIRWTAERLSALRLNFEDFRKFFGAEFDKLIGRTKFRYSLKFLQLFGYIKRYEHHLKVTRRGMFQRNLIGWAFVLNMPCRVVEEFLKTPCPLEVSIP